MITGPIHGSYPSDSGWTGRIPIPVSVAVAWIRATHGADAIDDKGSHYMNKGFTIVGGDYQTTYAVYFHDFGWFLINKDSDSLSMAHQGVVEKIEHA